MYLICACLTVIVVEAERINELLMYNHEFKHPFSFKCTSYGLLFQTELMFKVFQSEIPLNRLPRLKAGLGM